MYADKAHDGERRRADLRAHGIKPRSLDKAKRSKPLKPWQVWSNKAVTPIRAGVERLFATMKRTWGHHRGRCLGLSRGACPLRSGRGEEEIKMRC